MPSDCVVELPVEGFPPDPLTESLGVGELHADGYQPLAGWLELVVHLNGVVGPMDGPIVTCEVQDGAFTLGAEGEQQDGLDNVEFELTIEDGYVGPGRYDLGADDAFAVKVGHSDVGLASRVAATQCQVCIDPSERFGY